MKSSRQFYHLAFTIWVREDDKESFYDFDLCNRGFVVGLVKSNFTKPHGFYKKFFWPQGLDYFFLEIKVSNKFP